MHDEADRGCENTQFASFRGRQRMPPVVTQKKPAHTLAFGDERLSLQTAADEQLFAHGDDKNKKKLDCQKLTQPFWRAAL